MTIKKIVAIWYVVICFSCSLTALRAESFYSKTFLMPQWHRIHDSSLFDLWNKSHEESFQKNHQYILAQGVFQDSTQAQKVGSYFSPFGKNTITIATEDSDFDFSTMSFIHNPDFDQEMSAVLSFNPKRTVWGVNLGLTNTFDFNYYRWFLSINLPVLSVTHDLKMRTSEEVSQDIENTPYNIIDYFSGNFSQSVAQNQQALQFAKFGGKRTVIGLASLDLSLGCECVLNDDYVLKFHAMTSLPTGNKIQGVYLFEPVLGNGRHVELGFGLDAIAHLCKDADFACNLFAAAELSYLVPATEVRTVGTKHFQGANIPLWSWYELVGQNGGNAVLPAANILTIPLTISPGVTFESSTKVQFSWPYVDCMLGYCFKGKGAESGEIKSFEEDQYAFADEAYDTADTFNPDQDPNSDNYSPLLTKAFLNLSPALTPAQLTHTLMGAITLKKDLDEKELRFTLGARCDICSDNAGLDGYEVGGSFSITF